MVEVNKQCRGLFRIITGLLLHQYTVNYAAFYCTPLSEKILGEAERLSLWPDCLICSTGRSSQRGEIVLNLENISFADVTMKGGTPKMQIPQHYEAVSYRRWINGRSIYLPECQRQSPTST